MFAEDTTDILIRILTEKGIIAGGDLARLESATGEERSRMLTAMLAAKGILNAEEVARLNAAASQQEAHVVPAVYTPAAPNVSPAPTVAATTTAAVVPEPQAPANGPDTNAAPPAISLLHDAITLYGNLVLNGMFDTSLNNLEDIPLFASKKGSDPFPDDKSYAMTARQTRLGLRFNAPEEVAGAKVTGQVEVDFLGGKAAFANGVNMDLLRMRLAYGRLDWTNVSLEAGQDWSIFAPLNPTSFAEYAIPSMSASGNPWIRQPQIRAEFRHSMSDSSKILWQVSAADPNVGDYPTTTFSSGRSPLIGERGRMPAIESRLAFTGTVNGRDYTIGFSGHYNHGLNTGTIGALNVVQSVDSWGGALDWTLPFSKLFNITGEAYEGRALGIFSVASGESVGAVGTTGGHGVLSRGGWAQAQFNFNPKWQMNLAYGIDQPDAANLPVGNRDRNQTYMGNLMYKLSTTVTFAWEYRRFLTDFRNQIFADNKGDQANLAVVYSF